MAILDRMKRRLRHAWRHPGFRVFVSGLAVAMLIMLTSAFLPGSLVESTKGILAFLVAAAAIVGFIGLAAALLSAVQHER